MPGNVRANGDTGGKHVLVWNQIDLDPEDKKANSVPEPEGCVGLRHVVTAMLFLGMANAYVMRTNMSVAIVAMVNHTALPKHPAVVVDECGSGPTLNNGTHHATMQDGEFVWDTTLQGYILSSFFYGYVLTQIPFGILSKKYGARMFLGVGMLVNSVFGFLVPVAARHDYKWLILVRFIQGLGEGPIVPCTHAMLAKWVPPNERSRMGAFVYAGAQFGTVISMPVSGYLAEHGFDGGWPSIFYCFGLVGAIWSLAFLFMVDEDPETSTKIKEDERKYIISSVWGSAGISSPPVPWMSIVKSLPFWAILISHMGQNYGYETLMTELPTFMNQILHFNIKENGIMSSLPYLAMWMLSILISFCADSMIQKGWFSHTVVRKIANGIGQYGPGIALVAASYTGCNPYLTVAILTLGVGLNGGIYSGFKVNHLDISPRFAGILMSFTNCMANLAGLLAPIIAGYIIQGRPTQEAWREVFFISAGVYFLCSSVYLIFASGVRQPWDNPATDKPRKPNPSTQESQH
ncbi:putative inorganic phosphate cotransporter isoform X1 [Macrosteles quadrilineatus]|uniref:putative inorganic phosphate cotransporter isoform X1 n=2 Tax=Macrosteles quadrilineatus TaxID=74068 RepID=UPI0023E33F6F|nr:putative inorganic phosphate cotransporter isoform X1 [Macrosteles quadrilineatus]XP_054274491.1 putative inorganic phosphate cotransporter isoform X1 [Macrosteles quadrilineatus]